MGEHTALLRTVDWIAFAPAEHIEADLALFRGRTAQYIFISSATSAYQTPPRSCDGIYAVVQPILGIFAGKLPVKSGCCELIWEEDFDDGGTAITHL
ncbi:MAG: hypothetical protein R3E31_06085 [Chloroflexota bacterium]